MSYASLRSLPYEEAENSLLPARLFRLHENSHPWLELVELKAQMSEKSGESLPLSSSRIVENNGEPPTFPDPAAVMGDAEEINLAEAAADPKVKVFAIGIIVIFIGLLLLIALVFTKSKEPGLASASCLVIGTSAVALSLLRGQDREGYAG
jgi:hypothetical protein